jgi:hypothetical protein
MMIAKDGFCNAAKFQPSGDATKTAALDRRLVIAFFIMLVRRDCRFNPPAVPYWRGSSARRPAGTSGRPREGAAESRHEFLACPRPVEQRQQLSTEGILIPECLVIETWNDLVLAIEPARCGESLGTFAVSLFASG